MATATADPNLIRYATAAKVAGCPREQLENFIRAGIVLQPRQLQASAAARDCDLPNGPLEIGYGGARGGGKSHWLLAQMAADDCQRYAGLKCLLLRKVGKAGRESFEDLRRTVLRGIPNDYRRQEGILHFPHNDSRIVLGHFQNESDIDAYLGLEYDVIGVEEATTLSAAKYKAVRTCNRTSKPNWRPRTYSTTNPGNIGHAWYKARFIEPHRKERETSSRFVPATVDDNRFVNVENRQILDELIGWQLRAWRHGDWDIAAGQFFTNFRREHNGRPHHVIPWFQIPKSWPVWCSLDYGFQHYTTVYLLTKADGDVIIVDEHAERGWLPKRHAPAIEAMLQRNGVPLGRLSKFAASPDIFGKMRVSEEGLTVAQQYEALLGIPLERANDDRINGAGEILNRLGDVDANPPIPPRLFMTERCARLIECIPSLQHDPHRPEDVLKVDVDDEGNGGDDPYDGARYGVMVDYVPPRSGEAQAIPVTSAADQYAQIARSRGMRN